MECIAFDVEGGHFGVADFDSLGVAIGVEFAANREAVLRGGCRDQLDNRRPARQGLAAPILCNVTEQAVFDLVPFRRAGRIVADDDGQTRLVGELLQLDFP